MRTLLGLLLLIPAVSAQTPDSSATPRLVEAQVMPSPPERSQTLAAASLGGLGGVAVGAVAVYAISPPGPFGTSDEWVTTLSLTGGLALGAATAASLRRDRPFLRALGGAALGQAVGFGVGFLVDQTTGVGLGYALAMPAGAAVGAEWGTR